MKNIFTYMLTVALMLTVAGATTTQVAMSSNPEIVEFRGDLASDHLGNAAATSTRSLITADLNGDGIRDLVIASTDQGVGSTSYGAIHIIFGRSTWASHDNYADTIADVKIVGTSTEHLSTAITVADINGDSKPDLIVGSINATQGGALLAGAVYVFFGRNTWSKSMNLSNADVRITGTNNGDQFGYAVASGDVNGDGISDVIASCRGHDSNGLTNNGQVLIFFGTTTWPSSLSITAANVTISGPRTSAYLADSIWTCDFNNDGICDVFFSAYHDDDPSQSFAGYSGVVYGLMGRATASWPTSYTASSSTVDFYVHGVNTIYGLGYRGTTGDFNGDGIADIAVLATDSPSPRTVLFFGRTGFSGLSSGNVDTAADYIINYGNPNNNNGTPSDIHGGDFDGDGIDDLCVGFSTSSPNGVLSAGCVTVHYGRSSWGTDDPADLKYIGEASGDQLGNCVACGDITGDGIDDLIFNAPTASSPSRSSSGKVYVLAGGVSAAPIVSCSKVGSQVNLSVHSRSGRTLRLEKSTDLSTWTPISTYNSTGSDQTFTQSATSPRLFFRVAVNTFDAKP